MPLKFLLFLLFLPLQILAQRSGEFGLTGGATWYNGELNPNRQFYKMSPAAGLIYRHNWNYRYSIRFTGIVGTLKGDDRSYGNAFQNQRGLTFSSPVNELAAAVEFNFLPYEIGSSKFPFTFYVFGGFGIFRFNPVADGGDLQVIPNEPNKKYSNIQSAIPFGAGIKFSFLKRVGVFMEWGMRKTYTDYIDDVSTTWAPRLSGNEMVYGPFTGFQRGFSTNKDWYSYAGAGLVILLKKKYTCPAYNRGI